MEDIRVLAFFHIEEAAFMSFVGMGLIGIRLSWKQTLLLGLLQGIIVYLTRAILYAFLGMPFGVHVLLSFCSLVVLFHLVLKKDFAVCFAATIIAFMVVTLGEGIFALTAFKEPEVVSFDRLHRNVWELIRYSYLGSWLLVLMAAYLGVFKKPLINIEARQQKV